MSEAISTSFDLTDVQPPDSAAGKWLIAASVLLGTFLSVMDVTVVNVAMPHMMGAFGVNLLSITWVSTAYSIAEIIMVTMSAWFANLLGRKRLFLASMTVFITGSVIAGTSRTFNQMLLNRAIQGIGGGSLIPVSQAILRETFPPAEQGMAMAIYSMGVVLAPAIGPVAGGWLVDHYGWRWVFYINLPFCLAGLAMVTAFVLIAALGAMAWFAGCRLKQRLAHDASARTDITQLHPPVHPPDVQDRTEKR